MFGNDRNQMRQYFIDVWNKAGQNRPLEPLEKIIAEVIAQHPEYHTLLEQDGEAILARDYLPESGQTNPFLHMGMHIAMQEQLSSGRPAGIVNIYKSLTLQTGDAHEAEHKMMECMAEMLWQAQKNNTPPDEQGYLRALKKLSQL